MNEDTRETLLRQVCDYRTHFVWIFMISSAFAVIQAPYLVVVERGTALYAVSVLNFAGLLFFGGMSWIVLWRCRKLRERQQF